jgi:hypothetical protein
MTEKSTEFINFFETFLIHEPPYKKVKLGEYGHHGLLILANVTINAYCENCDSVMTLLEATDELGVEEIQD